VIFPFLLPSLPLPLPERLWDGSFPPISPYLGRIQDHSSSIKREKCRIQDSGIRNQESGERKFEIGNWKLVASARFHFLVSIFFPVQFPVSGLKVDDRPIVGGEAGGGDDHGVVPALCCRSS
jgi:hypothetical protein